MRPLAGAAPPRKRAGDVPPSPPGRKASPPRRSRGAILGQRPTDSLAPCARSVGQSSCRLDVVSRRGMTRHRLGRHPAPRPDPGRARTKRMLRQAGRKSREAIIGMTKLIHFLSLQIEADSEILPPSALMSQALQVFLPSSRPHRGAAARGCSIVTTATHRADPGPVPAPSPPASRRTRRAASPARAVRAESSGSVRNQRREGARERKSRRPPPAAANRGIPRRPYSLSPVGFCSVLLGTVLYCSVSRYITVT